MNNKSEIDAQKVYKVLSEASTALFDALIYEDIDLSRDMINAYVSARTYALEQKERDWVNRVIDQSFKIITGV